MSDEALALARAAAAAAPTDAALHFRLAEAQEDAGQLTAAIDSLRTAIRLRPEYAEAHAYLGLLLADAEDTEGAIASLRHEQKAIGGDSGGGGEPQIKSAGAWIDRRERELRARNALEHFAPQRQAAP